MSLIAYVSGHGFGHAAREVEILRRLPPEIPLVVKTSSPEWFWRSEVARPFTFSEATFDVGCAQTTSLDIDVAATREAWLRRDTENGLRLGDEVEELKALGARVVLTDVPSLPLVAAACAGIPGVLIANFTWADIYGTLAGFEEIAARLRDEYARATVLLDADLSLPMPYLTRREEIGLVARKGMPRREALLKRLPPAAANRRLALVYAGNWGLPLPWRLLETFTDWHFLSLTPPPDPVKNLTVLPVDAMGHPDLVASVDVVVSKPGYGLVGECRTAGTPLVYCPREVFAEYPALEEALSRWVGGIRLSEAAFLTADWSEGLGRVPPFRALAPGEAPGGANAAARLVELWHA